MTMIVSKSIVRFINSNKNKLKILKRKFDKEKEREHEYGFPLFFLDQNLGRVYKRRM